MTALEARCLIDAASVPEWAPTYTLDQQIAAAAADYEARHGRGSWAARVAADWEAN